MFPPEVWGEGAPRLRMMLTTPMTSCGAISGWPSRVTCSPFGLVESVIVDVSGITSRTFSFVKPAGSTTSRWIRYQTLGDVSPITGITNDPPVDPLVGGTNGWKCVL